MSDHGAPRVTDERKHIWDDPGNVDRLLYVFYACLVLLVALDFAIHRHIYHEWERIPAFHALYGFGACWILVVIAKQMRRFLMRDEDYYGDTLEDEVVGGGGLE